MIKLSEWKSCDTPPEYDGIYLVVHFYRGELGYAQSIRYTNEWGWNTDKYGHESAIQFGSDYFWCIVREVEDNE